MTDKLKNQLDQFKNAIVRLSEALTLESTRINKDATIQRFEFSFELAWKVMKSIAFEKGMEVISPKDSIRSAAQLGLIEDVERWFDFLDARNNSSHIYSEEMADAIYELIKEFLPAAEKLLHKIGNFII